LWALIIFQNIFFCRFFIGRISRRYNVRILVLRAIFSRYSSFLILDFLIGKILRSRFGFHLRRWFLNVFFCGNGLNLVNKLTDLLSSDDPLILASLEFSLKLIKHVLPFFDLFNEGLYSFFSSLDPC
jgi:hypothetical protein